MKKYPLVLISTRDHWVCNENTPMDKDFNKILASGILIKEDREGYLLSPMLFGYNPEAEENVMIYVAKTRSTTKQVLKTISLGKGK